MLSTPKSSTPSTPSPRPSTPSPTLAWTASGMLPPTPSDLLMGFLPPLPRLQLRLSTLELELSPPWARFPSQHSEQLEMLSEQEQMSSPEPQLHSPTLPTVQ